MKKTVPKNPIEMKNAYIGKKLNLETVKTPVEIDGYDILEWNASESELHFIYHYETEYHNEYTVECNLSLDESGTISSIDPIRFKWTMRRLSRLFNDGTRGYWNHYEKPLAKHYRLVDDVLSEFMM